MADPADIANDYADEFLQRALNARSQAAAQVQAGSLECEDDRDSVKRARNMAAQRLEHLQLDPMLGLRLLVESDHLGGFKTSVVPDNAYMLLDSKLADYIRSAEGPRLKFLPDIIHACTERLDELYNLPLAQFKDDEGNL